LLFFTDPFAGFKLLRSITFNIISLIFPKIFSISPGAVLFQPYPYLRGGFMFNTMVKLMDSQRSGFSSAFRFAVFAFYLGYANFCHCGLLYYPLNTFSRFTPFFRHSTASRISRRAQRLPYKVVRVG
jgi:hypothetical protein